MEVQLADSLQSARLLWYLTGKELLVTVMLKNEN